MVAQLSAPPEEAFAAEERALRDVIPGPYRWILPEDLFHAGDLYGQGRFFPSLVILAKAAQAQVYRLEASCRGGLNIAARCEEVRKTLFESEFQLSRQYCWGHWFRHGPVQTLADNRNVLNRQGLSMHSLWELAMGEAEDDTLGDSAYKKVKKQIPTHGSKGVGDQSFGRP